MLTLDSAFQHCNVCPHRWGDLVLKTQIKMQQFHNKDNATAEN